MEDRVDPAPLTPIRLALALPSLAQDGGAERVMLTLIRRLDRRYFAPILIVVDQGSADVADMVPADVPVYDLGVSRVRFAVLPLIRLLYRLRPQALLTGLGHLNLMVALIARSLPPGLVLIGRETSVVSEMNRELGLTALRNLAYRNFYPRLDRVICQSQDMLDDLTKVLRFPSDRAVLIHNPVDLETTRTRAMQKLDSADLFWSNDCSLKLVAVGRLAPQKGFDLLISALAMLPTTTFELLIIGQGELHDELLSQIHSLQLQGRVRLLGYQENPYVFMAQADAVVLSSRYEGLPNVVLEALACGTPVLATRAPGGLREISIIAGGILLADGISAIDLANVIRRFDLDRSAAGAPDMSAFGVDRIVPRYQDLIIETVRDG